METLNVDDEPTSNIEPITEGPAAGESLEVSEHNGAVEINPVRGISQAEFRAGRLKGSGVFHSRSADAPSNYWI